MAGDPNTDRRSKRVFSELPALILRKNGAGEAVTGDINANGMFLRTKEKAALGSLLQIQLALPDGLPPLRMFVTARFCGSSPGGVGIGVEIHVIGPEERRRWLDYYHGVLNQLGVNRAPS